ncbi:MAG: LLM class flavin-dependent oxidoreductase [Actinomycetota bacterium]
MARLACSLDPGRSLDEAASRARLAEELGYDSLWVTHVAAREPLQVLGFYARATDRIGLGTGVVPIVLRHPALLAMEAATLDEACGGRLRLGIGVSHRLTVEGWYGLSLDDPLGRMREHATILRTLLRERGVNLEGTHHTARFSFMGYSPPRPDLPVLFAALGPGMLRLAAELADGVILWMCNPGYVRDVVRPTLEEALPARGRSFDDFEVMAAVPVALTEDREAARDAFRRRALPYANLPFYRKAIAAGGHGEDLDRVDRGEPLSDAFCHDHAGIGDAAAVRAKIEEYRAAGVTLPSVGPLGRHPGGASVEETLEAVAGR